MDNDRREQELRGIAALVRAGNGGGGGDEYDEHDEPRDSVAGEVYAMQRPSTMASSGTLFVTGSDAIEKLSNVEHAARILSDDIDAQVTRESFKAAFHTWHTRWLTKAAKVRARGLISLNLAAGKICDELDEDETQLARWRSALLAEGGQPTRVTSAVTRAAASPEQEFYDRPKEKRGWSFSTILRWTGVLGTLFGIGYILRGIGHATMGSTGLLETVRGPKKQEPMLLPPPSYDAIEAQAPALPAHSPRFYGAPPAPPAPPAPRALPGYGPQERVAYTGYASEPRREPLPATDEFGYVRDRER